MFKLTIENKVYEYTENVTLADLAIQFNHPDCFVAKVNNRIRELGFYLNFDANVEFLDFTSFDAVRVYETSLRFMIIMALKELYPNNQVTFEQCISRSMSCHVDGVEIDEDFLASLEKKMMEIVEHDYPIKRTRYTKEEGLKLYESLGYFDKVETLAYRQENYVNAYECNGYVNYMFGYMVPSTRFLNKFKLRLYYPDFVVQYPRAEMGGIILEFEDSPNVSEMIRNARKWSDMIGGFTIAQMNSHINNNTISDFVNLCETKHNDMLADLGLRIKSRPDIRLICIAGPSSSGKTTFSNRLRIELMARGLRTIKISMDDYYLDRDTCPRDENGELDLEHIDALDVKLFNKQLLELIQGKVVDTPTFDFKTGKRASLVNTMHVDKDTIIIIEGIHALNEKMTASVPRNKKFKIYISPMTQINIDKHNPISATDVRLLRRIVRDYAYRKTTPEATLAMWPSVRRGEFRWIYPNQENADYIFNSELTYELCVLKKYALPQLSSIDHNSEFYIQANRLAKFLKYFKDIDDRYVPANSLIREFIGGASFYDE